jgi:hypothetical protein
MTSYCELDIGSDPRYTAFLYLKNDVPVLGYVKGITVTNIDSFIDRINKVKKEISEVNND